MRHEAALRLFNGFAEGCPDLVVDLYARTLVLYNYTHPPQRAHATLLVAPAVSAHAPSLDHTIVLKTRHATPASAQHGVLLFGSTPARRVREQGIWHAVQPLMHRDASFYVDTRNLRAWARQNLADKTVLNTFAYTGSLGIAALYWIIADMRQYFTDWIFFAPPMLLEYRLKYRLNRKDGLLGKRECLGSSSNRVTQAGSPSASSEL